MKPDSSCQENKLDGRLAVSWSVKSLF